jgi:ADP-heptose:LPS heptosyltransferase
LLDEVARRHPDKKVWLIINPRDRGAHEFLAAPVAPNCEVKTFSSLSNLLGIIVQLDAYYGTDTGLYHLAAAMGVPATVMFGPTQPQRIVMPRQPGATWVRLQVLGASHCEIKDCRKPLCVYQCVASFARAECATPLEATPPACPLRAFGAAALPAITVCQPALS